MYFETTEHECELFLTAEGIGFLMLSADGEILRKWQGLTIGEMSICAGVRWEFAHTHQTQPLRRSHWKSTKRDSVSITRSWLAACGCELLERWDWSAPSQGLVASLRLKPDDKRPCHSSQVYFKAVPLWTLSQAGDPTCGNREARLIQNPSQPQTLLVSPADSTSPLEVSCFSQMYPGQFQHPGEWQLLPTATREWCTTPKDAQRGEQSAREILLSHAFQLETTASGSARIVFSPPKAEGVSLYGAPVGDRVSPTSVFTSTNEQLAHAFANTTESLNQLIQTRSDGVIGLQAGLPWFTQFWTRDLCHSFRAAFLWAGRTDAGTQLITGLWLASRTGVVPNYTTAQTTTNNSADALPLLLMSTADLIDHCGWSSKLEDIRPSILEKLLEASNIFSKGGLVEHGHADTWMDAQKCAPDGMNIPCSPRANRAFEIQAFWIAALRRWSLILDRINDQKHSETFLRASKIGLKAIRKNYLSSDASRWADTLRPDGSGDFSIRPNVLLGFSALLRSECLEELLNSDELNKCIEVMLESDLIVPYGVRTLSPETSVQHPLPLNNIFQDESPYIHESKIHFHPYHEFGTRTRLEHPDWAYHNGTIWPWLSGSATEVLLRTGQYELAQRLCETLVHHSTQGSHGGALPELLDGLSSHSSWSWPKGAPHQAWSEAAFLHIILESWIGLRLMSFGEKLIVDTTLWQRLPDFKLEFAARSGRVKLNKDNETAALAFLPNKPGTTLNVCERNQRHGALRESLQTATAEGSIPLKLWNS